MDNLHSNRRISFGIPSFVTQAVNWKESFNLQTFELRDLSNLTLLFQLAIYGPLFSICSI